MKSGDTLRIRPYLIAYDEPEGVPPWVGRGFVVGAALGMGVAVWLALSTGG